MLGIKRLEPPATLSHHPMTRNKNAQYDNDVYMYLGCSRTWKNIGNVCMQRMIGYQAKKIWIMDAM
jgi:hypothetical protein